MSKTKEGWRVYRKELHIFGDSLNSANLQLNFILKKMWLPIQLSTSILTSNSFKNTSFTARLKIII